MTKAHKTLTSHTLAGFSWTYFSLIFQAILQLVTLAVLARMLGPSEFGVVSLALIFTTFMERVGFLGIGPALVQKPVLRELEIRGAFTFSILIGIVAMVIFYFGAESVAVFMNNRMLGEVLQALSVLCLIESACQILEHLLQRDFQFKRMLISGNIAYAVGNGLISTSLAFLGYGVWSLVVGTVVTRTLRLSFYYYLRPIELLFYIPFKEMKELIVSGIGFAWSRLFSFIAVSGDNFIVGKMLGAAALGIYGRAYQLMSLPSNYFGQVLEKVLFPAMSKKQAEPEHLRRVFLWAIQLSSIVGIPCSIFIYIAAPEIVSILFGNKWNEVIPTLKILSLGVFFRLAYKNSDTLIRSVGAVYRHAFRQLAYSAIVIFGSYYGVAYGTEGVALSVLGAVFANYMILSELGLRILSLSWKKFFQAHMAAVWMGTWSILLVPGIFYYLRAQNYTSLTIFILGLVVQCLILVISNKLCPKVFRADVVEWIIARIGLSKRGKIGAILARALV